MKWRIPLAVGTLAAVALFAGAGVGVGGTDSVKSKVKISEGGPDRFEGKVSSNEPKCEKKRKVSLHYEFDGPYKRGEVLGTDKTDADGDWELDGSFMAGLYYVTVKEKSTGDLTCRADRSKQKQY